MTPRPILCASTRPGRSCGYGVRTATSSNGWPGCRRPSASGEEVHDPYARGETEALEEPGDLEEAYGAGRLRPFAARGRGPRADPRMGELAGRLDAERSLYRGLRPEAHATMAYLSAGVRSLAGDRAPADLTSTVRDLSYQRLLARDNLYATRAHCRHGAISFDVRRRYGSRAQAAAFQHMPGLPPVPEPDRLGPWMSSTHHRLPRGGRAGLLWEVHFRHACRLVAQTASRPPPARQPRADRDGQPSSTRCSSASQRHGRADPGCVHRPPSTSPAVRTLPPSSPRQSSSAQDTVVSDTELTSGRPRVRADRSARTRRRRRTGRGRGRPKAPADRSSRRSRASTRIPRNRLRSGRSQVVSAIHRPAPRPARAPTARSGRGKRLIAKLHTIARTSATRRKLCVRPRETGPGVTPPRKGHELVRQVDAGYVGALLTAAPAT